MSDTQKDPWSVYKTFTTVLAHERLEDFKKKSLKQSTATNFNYINHELGFAVDQFETMADPIKKIKIKIVQNTPILTLNHVFDSCGNQMKNKHMFSDEKYREFAASQKTDQLLIAAYIASINVTEQVSALWKLFLEKVIFKDEILPDVSGDIFDTVFNHRCPKEKKYLNKANKEQLQLIWDNLGTGEILNKKNLCRIIADINTVQSIKTDKKIENFLQKLNKYRPIDENAVDDNFNRLSTNYQVLAAVIANWDDVKNTPDVCDKLNCVTRVQKLHDIAEKVARAVEECDKELSRLKNNQVIVKSDSILKSVGQKFQSLTRQSGQKFRSLIGK